MASFHFFGFIAFLAVSVAGQRAPAWCPAVGDENFQTMDFRFTQTQVPAQETTYMCQEFLVPSNVPYHITAYEPLIDNAELLHHIVIYACDHEEEVEEMQRIGGYPVPRECSMTPACTTLIPVLWAFGQPNCCFGSGYGAPMGSGYYSKMVMQVHYNNPSKKSGGTDTSGVRLYFTRYLRENDIALMTIGQELLAIPPKTKSTVLSSKTFQSDSCASARLGDTQKTYYMAGALFHMHKTGVHGRLTLVRSNGERVDVIKETMTYDRPTIRVWNDSLAQSLSFTARDNFEVECTFDSSDRGKWTFWGPATSDEMCYAFVTVYPKPGNGIALSIPNVGKFDSCQLDVEMNENVGDCKMSLFYTYLNEIYESETANLTASCGCPRHPAEACTQTCYKFLEEWNLFGTGCLSDETLVYHTTRLWVVPNTGEAMTVASQARHCFLLSSEPGEDATCETSSAEFVSPSLKTIFIISTVLYLIF